MLLSPCLVFCWKEWRKGERKGSKDRGREGGEGRSLMTFGLTICNPSVLIQLLPSNSGPDFSEALSLLASVWYFTSNWDVTC